MSLTLDELAAQALQLPPASRAQLAEQLVESLADSDIDEIRQLWTAEAIRRRDEVRSGSVQPIPGDRQQNTPRGSVTGFPDGAGKSYLCW